MTHTLHQAKSRNHLFLGCNRGRPEKRMSQKSEHI